MKKETLMDRIMRVVFLALIALALFWGFQKSAIVANIILYFGLITIIVGIFVFLLRIGWKSLKNS